MRWAACLVAGLAGMSAFALAQEARAEDGFGFLSINSFEYLESFTPTDLDPAVREPDWRFITSNRGFYQFETDGDVDWTFGIAVNAKLYNHHVELNDVAIGPYMDLNFPLWGKTRGFIGIDTFYTERDGASYATSGQLDVGASYRFSDDWRGTTSVRLNLSDRTAEGKDGGSVRVQTEVNWRPFHDGTFIAASIGYTYNDGQDPGDVFDKVVGGLRFRWVVDEDQRVEGRALYTWTGYHSEYDLETPTVREDDRVDVAASYSIKVAEPVELTGEVGYTWNESNIENEQWDGARAMVTATLRF